MKEHEHLEHQFRMAIAEPVECRDAGWASFCGWLMTVIVLSVAAAAIAPAGADPVAVEMPTQDEDEELVCMPEPPMPTERLATADAKKGK